jgi:hypothetical protein
MLLSTWGKPPLMSSRFKPATEAAGEDSGFKVQWAIKPIKIELSEGSAYFFRQQDDPSGAFAE